MNPAYLPIVDVLELITLFVVGPLISAAIGIAAWRGKPTGLNREKYGIAFVVLGAIGFCLLMFVQRMQADVRTLQYFLQLACFVVGALFLGVAGGCMLGIFTYRTPPKST